MGRVTLLLSLFADDIAPPLLKPSTSGLYVLVFCGILLALFNNRINAVSMNAGIVAGVLGNAILWLFFPEIFWFWWNLIGFVVAVAVAFVSALFVKGDAVTAASQTQSEAQPNWQFHSILTMKDVAILLTMKKRKYASWTSTHLKPISTAANILMP